MIGVAMIIMGAALGALVFLPWFLATGFPGVHLSGVGGAGELWTVAALAAVIVGCGVLVAARRGARAAALVSIAAATLAAVLCLSAILFIPAHVVIDQLGMLRGVDLPRETGPVAITPAAYLAMTAAALSGLLGLLALSAAPPPGMPGP